MIVRSLQTEGFRNLHSQKIDFEPGLSLLLGDNGQGKTNVLEAIHLLSSLRSFRPIKLRDAIQEGGPRADLRAVVEDLGSPLELRLTLEPSGRRTWIGARSIREAEGYLGRFQAVAFTPDDLAMVKGSPAQRRRFLDRAIFLQHPAHLLAVKDFHAALRARNRLLREVRLDTAQVEAFSLALSRSGAEVTARRQAFVASLGEAFSRSCHALLGGPVSTGLELKPGWRFREQADPESLRQQLEDVLPRDRARGVTGIGPQLDDLDIRWDGQPARRWASQGQQRALAIGLLLALVDQVTSAGAEQPVLLLDDVSSELDAGNRRRLFERVRGLRGQVLVTSTDARLLEEIGVSAHRYRVVKGRVTRETNGGQ